jgi:curved DNA-binding protein
MTSRDLYEVLGVPRGATEQQIRKAYRELARKNHPDRNPGNKQAEERFKEASYASEVLLNKDKRRLYDEFGEQGLREGFNPDAYRQYVRSAEARRSAGASGGFGSLEDLLNQVGAARGGGGAGGRVNWGRGIEDLFGGDVSEAFGGARARNRRRDAVSDVTIPFMEAVQGGEKEISIQIAGDEAPRTIRVRVPPGVRDGGRIRLRGQGFEGGDLVLRVHVTEHPFFRREGDDLHLELPITVGEAYNGAKVQVPTPDGAVSLRIPKRAKGGSRLRLRGKGVRHGENQGDLIVQLQIVLPESDAVADAAAALEQGYTESVRKHLEG